MKKMRIASVLTACAMLCGMMVGCGGGKEEGFTWTLEDGVLTISGNEPMPEWDYGECPWYEKCAEIKKVVIEDGITSISDSAFNRCDSLTEVTIPDSVTSIGFGAFSNCDSLTEVLIPDSVTSIGSNAFYCCHNLTEVTIQHSVTDIGRWAFIGCSSLTEITIPDSVTNIGDEAFCACESLNDVYYTGTEAEWNAISIGSGNEELTSATIHFGSAG